MRLALGSSGFWVVRRGGWWRTGLTGTYHNFGKERVDKFVVCGQQFHDILLASEVHQDRQGVLCDFLSHVREFSHCRPAHADVRGDLVSEVSGS
jgi:hypothetical protein